MQWWPLRAVADLYVQYVINSPSHSKVRDLLQTGASSVYARGRPENDREEEERGLFYSCRCKTLLLTRQATNYTTYRSIMNDVLDPSANVITVTGMRCVGVPTSSTNGVFSSEVCQALRKAKIQDWGSGMMDMVGPSHVQERITHAVL